MPLYTFYPCKRAGHSDSFITREAIDDQEAFAWARRVLEEHKSASHVIAWSGERRVFTVERSSPERPLLEKGPQAAAE